MSTRDVVDSSTAPATEDRRSWVPMVGLFLAQVLMSFNVAALPVSLGGMVEDFGVPPTVASTTIVVYGLAVAALVMTGAKLGQRIGWVAIFRVVVATFAGSALLMILSPTVAWAITGQAVAGASAAIIVPALVALIAENYRGPQQATAIGSLGSARAVSGMSAFFIGGALGTLIGWRPTFAIVLALAVAVFVLSFRLRSDAGDPGIRIDLVAAVLIGAAVVSLTLGFNNLNAWGLFFASEGAPFDLVGVSPAPLLVLLGVVLGQTFFWWTRRRTAAGKVPLVDLSVLARPSERAAVYAMFVVVALEAALNFTVPLYIQI
ncbi:MAG: MFS transporter, partial [Cellulosimicrobium cellulans]